MSKLSNKRAHISISGALHAKLKAYAAKNNLALAVIVEKAVAPVLGDKSPPSRPARRYRGPRG